MSESRPMYEEAFTSTLTACDNRLMTNTAQPDDALLDIKHVAALLNISPRTLWRLMRQGKISHVKIGDLTKFRRSAVDEFIEANTIKTSTDLLDAEEAARYLGTSARHIRELWARRELTAVKVGRLNRFDPADLAAYVTKQRVEVREGP